MSDSPTEPARDDAAAAAPRAGALVERRRRIRPGDRGPVPDVVEGNSLADWDLWEASVFDQEIREFVASGFSFGHPGGPRAAVPVEGAKPVEVDFDPLDQPPQPDKDGG